MPRLTANGALLRVNYQIDGSNNTQKDRAGLRQMPMSEVMIREVKVVTTGYAPEFGQTMGLIYNAITPSGTNTFKGQGSYRFQRDAVRRLPVLLPGPAHRRDASRRPTSTSSPSISAARSCATARTSSAATSTPSATCRAARVITITPANQAALGLSEPPYMPTALNTEFAIGKVDHQLSANNRLSVRYIFFDNFITNNIGGGINSVQRGTDFSDRQHSTAAQLISTIRTDLLNELRVQYATRAQGRVPGRAAGTGPAINVTNVANFGGPIAGDADAGFGVHAERLPGQRQPHLPPRRPRATSSASTSSTSPTPARSTRVPALHLRRPSPPTRRRRSGANPFGYTHVHAVLRRARPRLLRRTSTGCSCRTTGGCRRLVKLLYGLRYDLYDVPAPNADRAVRGLARLPRRQEQLRAARSAWSGALGAAIAAR